jgi:uncharacterized protein
MENSIVVVTGASSGIGFELARIFAENGRDVLVTSENESRLNYAASQLASMGTNIITHAANLATTEGVDSLIEVVRSQDCSVDILCVNAGVGVGGAFIDTDINRELEMISLNVCGSVQLAKPILQDMAQRGSGHVLFTSSIAATAPAPFEAVYGATKAFLRSFGESVRDELKEKSVGVTVLMPGLTDTNIFARAGMLDTKAGASQNKDDPADVAKAAYDAVMAGRHKVVPSIKNKLIATMGDFAPAPIAAKAHRRLSKPGSAG